MAKQRNHYDPDRALQRAIKRLSENKHDRFFVDEQGNKFGYYSHGLKIKILREEFGVMIAITTTAHVEADAGQSSGSVYIYKTNIEVFHPVIKSYVIIGSSHYVMDNAISILDGDTNYAKSAQIAETKSIQRALISIGMYGEEMDSIVEEADTNILSSEVDSKSTKQSMDERSIAIPATDHEDDDVFTGKDEVVSVAEATAITDSEEAEGATKEVVAKVEAVEDSVVDANDFNPSDIPSDAVDEGYYYELVGDMEEFGISNEVALSSFRKDRPSHLRYITATQAYRLRNKINDPKNSAYWEKRKARFGGAKATQRVRTVAIPVSSRGVPPVEREGVDKGADYIKASISKIYRLLETGKIDRIAKMSGLPNVNDSVTLKAWIDECDSVDILSRIKEALDKEYNHIE